MSWGYQELDNSVYAEGRAGWAGCGVVMPGKVSPEEAFEIAGLGYPVEKVPVYRRYEDQGGVHYRPLDHVGGLTARMDLAGHDQRGDMALVGRGYNTIQNADGVLAIASAVCKEAGGQVETAGTLHNGKNAWILIALPTGDHVKEDKIARFLCITNAHDATGALTIFFTNVRVICANTLAMALSGTTNKYTVRHTGYAQDRIAQVIELLGRSESYFKTTMEKFNHWADTPIDPELAELFVTTFKTTDAKKVRTYTENQQAEILSLFNGRQRGSHIKGVNGTAYGLYNAVTEWIDHKRISRGRNSQTLSDGTVVQGREANEARFDSVMFGSGAAERQKAAYMVNEVVRAIDDNPNEAVDKLMAGIDYGKTVTNKVLDEWMTNEIDLG
jgi:phage/plasmid-like protein (TIGR03299 family)